MWNSVPEEVDLQWLLLQLEFLLSYAPQCSLLLQTAESVPEIVAQVCVARKMARTEGGSSILTPVLVGSRFAVQWTSELSPLCDKTTDLCHILMQTLHPRSRERHALRFRVENCRQLCRDYHDGSPCIPALLLPFALVKSAIVFGPPPCDIVTCDAHFSSTPLLSELKSLQSEIARHKFGPLLELDISTCEESMLSLQGRESFLAWSHLWGIPPPPSFFLLTKGDSAALST